MCFSATENVVNDLPRAIAYKIFLDGKPITSVYLGSVTRFGHMICPRIHPIGSLAHEVMRLLEVPLLNY